MEHRGHIWDRYISPQTLLEQIEHTAPFLFQRDVDSPLREKQSLKGEIKNNRLIELNTHPYAYLDVIESARHFEKEQRSASQQIEDYFALCCSAHQATVMTFVPTDVDSKIRGILWNEAHGTSLDLMLDFTLKIKVWSVRGVSLRYVNEPTLGDLSGHDGEWFSVASGGCGRFLSLGQEEKAMILAEKIEEELWREAQIFKSFCKKHGKEIETLRASFAICHNLGDLDQGLSYWDEKSKKHPIFQKFQRLAHDNISGYGGIFPHIVGLYKELLSAEGHRNYPLRAVKSLRRSADLLIPLAPFFDDWGALIGQSKILSDLEKVEVMDALVRGCRKVQQQEAYYRALAGWQDVNIGGFQRIAELLPTSSKKMLKESDFRQKLSIPKRSFESTYLKKVEKLRPLMNQFDLTAKPLQF